MDFITMLVEMQGGETAMAINAKLAELMTAIKATAGSGKLTVEITIKPSKLGMGGVVQMVESTADVKIKKPELGLGSSIFFLTEEGTLSRQDPRQEQMFEEERING